MRRIFVVLFLAVFLISFATAALGVQGPQPARDPAGAVTGPLAGPPKTEVSEVKENIHGVEIVDSYRWLEDQNSPQTRAWIDAENAYTDSLMTQISGREALKAKVAALLKIESMSAPQLRNGRYFFSRRQANQDQASLFMRKGLEGKDDLLIDPLTLSPEHTITVGLNAISQDGSLIVYSLRQGGEDETTPHLFDVDAHKDLPDKFPHADYFGIAILPDKTGLYLTRRTPEGPRVYFHKFGTDSSADVEIFGKGYGGEKIIGSSLSADGRYLVIEVSYGSAATKSEVYVQDLKNKGPLVTIVNDVEAAFEPAIGGDKMYLRTNWNAPKWRVMEVDLKNPGRDHWREVIPQGENVLEGMSLVGGKLAVEVTENVVAHVKL
jgi:prolyl oligopeptidase